MFKAYATIGATLKQCVYLPSCGLIESGIEIAPSRLRELLRESRLSIVAGGASAPADPQETPGGPRPRVNLGTPVNQVFDTPFQYILTTISKHLDVFLG